MSPPLWIGYGLCLAMLAGAWPSRAQHVHPTVPKAEPDATTLSFIEQARAATERFRDLDVAIASGFRRIGPAMPNMGEHWVNPRLVLIGGLDPTNPSVLTYLRVDGDPVLTGVAYSASVLPGESAPELPVQGAAWHYHSGSVEEELAGGTMHEVDSSGVQLAMVHAWIWIENPDGVFAADNWALPFVQLGLPVPEQVTRESALALYLACEGIDYYTSLIEQVGNPSEADRRAVRAVFDASRVRVERLIAASGGTPGIDDLTSLWRSLWLEVEHRVSWDTWSEIESLSR